MSRCCSSALDAVLAVVRPCAEDVPGRRHRRQDSQRRPVAISYGRRWGLTEVGHESGVTYLAAEARPEQYILRVRRAADTRLDLVSSGAADHESVDHLAQQLHGNGVRLVTEADALRP